MIKGPRVHDVGYRLFLLEIAESSSLISFQARNIEDGIEVLIEGTDANINNFLRIAPTTFPERAEVEKIIVEDYEGPIISVESFYRLFTLQQLVKMADAGIEMR